MQPGPSGIACSFLHPLDAYPATDEPVRILHASSFEMLVSTCSLFSWAGDLFAMIAGRGFALAGHVGVDSVDWEGSSRVIIGVGDLA